jgi:hypothetical protein
MASLLTERFSFQNRLGIWLDDNHVISNKLVKFYGCPRTLSCYISLAAVRMTEPNASVAQLVEQLTLNQLVLGSNPSRGTFPKGCKSMICSLYFLPRF